MRTVLLGPVADAFGVSRRAVVLQQRVELARAHLVQFTAVGVAQRLAEAAETASAQWPCAAVEVRAESNTGSKCSTMGKGS